MSTLEDRLRSTLTARAELVTAERLSPAVPPTAQAPVRSRRPAILAVVLATVAVALVAVVMLTPDPVRRPAPQPPAGPVPSPSVPASPSPSHAPQVSPQPKSGRAGPGTDAPGATPDGPAGTKAVTTGTDDPVPPSPAPGGNDPGETPSPSPR